MHIHKIKPVHGWKEFLNEIAIIVVGVLIALSLEQGVEALHEQRVRQEAREAILAERARIKRITIEHRRLQHRKLAA